MKIQRSMTNKLVIMFETRDEEIALKGFICGEQTGRGVIAQLMIDMGKQILDFGKL